MRLFTFGKSVPFFLMVLLLTGCASDGAKRWTECALIGAGTGGLAGAAVGNSSNDSGKNAAYGAVGGALIGAAICALQKDTDHDKDGVTTKHDRCKNTPAGVKVDNHGCPLDSDKDGVADHKDRCKNTPAGVKVDQYGCPLITDRDGDGVVSAKDKCPNTPKGVPVDADGCPLQRELGSVYFGFDKSEINTLGREELDQIAAKVKKHPKVHLVSVGYTDSTGPEEYNMKLAMRRAESVKQYLVEHGVPANRITASAGGVLEFGDQTPKGREHNRHVTVALDL
ncbi:OmpA family protein [Endozoicomonas ascidiicola]|uniref:OmpA family protein n=1 Tax=Endozoicomonas ascidiicola TaxID=1698521 RepID=UPI000836DCC3|nr:OmpA family protein [Endozoicomonas ascidiicola]